MEELCSQRLSEVEKAGPEESAPVEADRICLACILLAREDRSIIGKGLLPTVEACAAQARPGLWQHLDPLPWFLIGSYLSDGANRSRLVNRVESYLGHSDSSIREWFHYVA